MKKKLNNILYIKLYGEKDRVNNRLLVIGFGRYFFGFKYFLYINLAKSK